MKPNVSALVNKNSIAIALNNIVAKAGEKCIVCGSTKIEYICAGCGKAVCHEHFKDPLCKKCTDAVCSMTDDERNLIDMEIIRELEANHEI